MAVAGSKSNKNSDNSLMFIIVKAPPAKAGDFRLQLKVGLTDHAADFQHYTLVVLLTGFGGF